MRFAELRCFLDDHLRLAYVPCAGFQEAVSDVKRNQWLDAQHHRQHYQTKEPRPQQKLPDWSFPIVDFDNANCSDVSSESRFVQVGGPSKSHLLTRGLRLVDSD